MWDIVWVDSAHHPHHITGKPLLGAEPGTQAYTAEPVTGWNQYLAKAGRVSRHIAQYISLYPWSRSVMLVPG